MAQPYLGEIRLLPFTFAPKSWAYCNGQILPINQNQPLFALIGTTYGGNGVNTFMLPDLRGRAVNSQGKSRDGTTYAQGEIAGAENVTVMIDQLPVHVHTWMATSDPANSVPPTGNVFGNGRLAGSPLALYAPPNTGAPVRLAKQTVGIAGGSVPHNNMQPYLVLAYCIALQGIFPSRN